MLSIWNVAWLLVSVFVLRCAVVYGYRLLLHPLAGFAGPSLAKLSDWYGVYQSFNMRLHLATWKGHETYGPVFRQGPNKLVFNTISGLNSIYQGPNIQKSPGYLVMQPAPGVFNIHTAIDKKIHRFKRKVIGQGLSDQCMRRFEQSMLDHIDLFVECLVKSFDGGQAQPDPVNMTHAFKYLGFDIMGHFGFGQSFDMQTKDKNRFLTDAVSAANHRHHTCIQFPFLGKIGIERFLYPHILGARKLYAQLTTDMVNRRLSMGKHAQDDLFSFIVDAKDTETGRGFSERELWSETRFLLVAGADTTSTTMTALFFYLSRYPDCYKALTKEIRSKFSSYQDIKSGPLLSSCTYLRACIDESMRMSPPVSGTLWREVKPAPNEQPDQSRGNGSLVNGIWLPEGTLVGVNIYAIHHSDEYFPDPFTFKPERWIAAEDSEPEKERLRTMRQAFCPFSIGSRACAGKSMAYMEASLTLARTLWCLDFEQPTGPLAKTGAGERRRTDGRNRENEFQLYEHLTSSHDGPYLSFRWRNEECQQALLNRTAVSSA